MKEHDFKQSLSIEKDYRSTVLPALSQLIPYQDVGDDSSFFSSGIDFLHKNEHTDTTSDAKIDSYTTGNLCYELYSSDRQGGSMCLNPGWGIKSRAAIIIYVFSATAEAVVFELDKIRPWMEKNWRRFETVSVYNKPKYNGMGYLAWNSLIPLSALLDPVTGVPDCKIFNLGALIKAPREKPNETSMAKKAKVPRFASRQEFVELFQKAPKFSAEYTYNWDELFEEIIKKDKFFTGRQNMMESWMEKLASKAA